MIIPVRCFTCGKVFSLCELIIAFFFYGFVCIGLGFCKTLIASTF
ncbi:hypothetical protein SOVF_207710 [Spinacia oleracea]|nr:hypothetical protein SOVF_207710 [Spinacia oleracea]